MPGLFIAFEGIDGSGKSSACRAVAATLRDQGVEVVSTREPGGTPIGQQLRALVLESDHRLLPETELLLMCADRAEHVATLIRPALRRNMIVLCDRFAASTRAYQGFGLGLPMNEVDEALFIATGGLEPDLTLLFDVDPVLALARRSADPANLNNLDMRDLAFRERVRNGYLVLAAQDDTWRLIDASEPLDSVIAHAREVVNNLLAARHSIR